MLIKCDKCGELIIFGEKCINCGIYELCKCGQIAKWVYMPSHENEEDDYFCDNCVPRGCSCNEIDVCIEFNDEYILDYPKDDMIEGKDWQWVEKGRVWELLDNGKQYPCIEYWYFKNGVEKE